MPSELQVVVSLSNRAYHAMATGGNPNWTKIKEEVKATQPPCADYLDTLCDFVALYAGGAGAPVVRFLEGFAKEFAGSRKLGEAFLSAVNTMKFPTESSKFPFVRAALLATNLIAPKHQVVNGSRSFCGHLAASPCSGTAAL